MGSLYQADELTLICSEGAVTGGHGAAEEGDRVPVLNEHHPKPMRRGVTLDDEGLGEVRHGEDEARSDRGLERGKGRGGLLTPREAILLKKNGQRCRDGAIVVDELAVVAHQAKEPAHRSCRARYRAILNGLHLCRVHGDACLRDNVAEVCDGGDPECALGALDEEDMSSKLGKDHAEMPKMIRPRLVVYQYIVKENEDKATKEGAEYIVHKRLKSCRGIAQAERHDQELIHAVVGTEHCLVDVLLPHAQLMVPRAQVELGEESGAVEFIKQLINDRDRKRVLDHERVQCAVVDAEPS
jgi:hypothetical protein